MDDKKIAELEVELAAKDAMIKRLRHRVNIAAERQDVLEESILATGECSSEIAAERDQLRAAINLDGSLTDHQQFVDMARDGAHALKQMGPYQREVDGLRRMLYRLVDLLWEILDDADETVLRLREAYADAVKALEQGKE